MPAMYKVAVFEGDGIGPEIMEPTVALLELLNESAQTFRLAFQIHPAGAAHYAVSGESLPEESFQAASAADAILLSAMGLPSVRYKDGTEISPQIELRKKLDLFAGVRPVRVLPTQRSPLKIPADKHIDFVLIRESTEGLFWSQGRGTVTENEARETMVITRKTSEKLFDFAFKLARQRGDTRLGKRRVTCVDKANVFRAFAFFREIFDEFAKENSDISSDHAYVDATALWMVQKPWDFDVLVTENMFGDILSDLGAGLMGGLGVAPSADIGEGHAVFQPCHGSAPDIAGQGIANPMAMILSAAMMLDWLGHEKGNLEMIEKAKVLTDAVYRVMEDGRSLTRDLEGQASTSECVAAIRNQLAH